MKNDWLVKIRRYDGSESVLAHYMHWDDAQSHAARLNRETQSKQHYVALYDSALAKGF